MKTKTKKHLGVEYRISEGIVEHKGGIKFTTYIPQINTETFSFKNLFGLKKNWKSLKGSFLKGNSTLNEKEKIDQLEEVEKYIKSQIRYMLEFKSNERFIC